MKSNTFLLSPSKDFSMAQVTNGTAEYGGITPMCTYLPNSIQKSTSSSTTNHDFMY